MKVREEINKYAKEEDKPILLWLLDNYHWGNEWRFVAFCVFERDEIESYIPKRIWKPTIEGKALYEYFNL